MKIIACKPGESNFRLFNKLTEDLYPENSLRFKSGNEPETKYLVSCYVLVLGKKPKARYAIYNNPDLYYKGKKAISIGSYECVKDNYISKIILNHAKEKARELGAEILIGPMEGSTWANYRFSLDNDTSNFFLEPYHNIYYNKQFVNFGFKKIEDYYSNYNKTISFDDDFIKTTENNFNKKGLYIRNMKSDLFEDELYKIGTFTIEVFKKNILYSPLKPAEFVEKYKNFKDYLLPELVFIAEDSKKEIHGIFYGIPNYLNPESKTIIIKTIARKMETPFKKDLINLLMHKFSKQSIESGFKNEVHAFIHQDNASGNVSKRYSGKDFKSYALYAYSI